MHAFTHLNFLCMFQPPDVSNPLVISTPTASISQNGHHSPAVYSDKSHQLNYLSNSMFSPSFQVDSKSPGSGSDSTHRRRSVVHNIHKSRLGKCHPRFCMLFYQFSMLFLQICFGSLFVL